MYPILFDLGFIKIYSYGVFVCIGIIAGYLVARRQLKNTGVPEQTFSDIVFWSIVWGFFGAKLLYLIVEWRYAIRYPLDVIRSGFVFYGGLVSGVIAVFFLVKKYKVDFFKIGDLFALAMPLAHAFGRIGCFLNGCCYGVVTDAGHGLLFHPFSPAGMTHEYIFPLQLVSSAFLFVLFLFLYFLYTRKKTDGLTLVLYGMLYGIFRFIIEFFRGDDRGGLFGLSTSQIVSILVVLFAFVVLFYVVENKKNDSL
ncbi:MAG: prolipoprotein diacylglyceryl transferase [Candidatus Omnitrophica bacterium]|nr:prolipoprotein diacylglyceryl transferase [Candidatus Omnitrophota bacterium]MDD5440880.1 prolipoprotein diacylglyceryl transferase [Candidatus Omnitrophota bacterium]